MELQLLLLLLACTLFRISATTLSSLARDQGRVVFTYPRDVHSERDLSECPPQTACNVIYRRFWQSLLIERQCRCPIPNECSWQWSDGSDNRTMFLDNRAQMKFCTSLEEMSECDTNQHAITVSTQVFEHTTKRPYAKKVARTKLRTASPSQHRMGAAEHHAVAAHCNCRGLPYWSPGLEKDEYLCSQLGKCNRGELCGYIRIDLHSIYYLCSCPDGHQCVSQDKRTYSRQLLLYSGPSYNASCMPIFS